VRQAAGRLCWLRLSPREGPLRGITPQNSKIGRDRRRTRHVAPYSREVARWRTFAPIPAEAREKIFREIRQRAPSREKVHARSKPSRSRFFRVSPRPVFRATSLWVGGLSPWLDALALERRWPLAAYFERRLLATGARCPGKSKRRLRGRRSASGPRKIARVAQRDMEDRSVMNSRRLIQ
jgi:hypothetical protein